MNQIQHSSPALERMQQQLTAAGMDTESCEFLLGRMMRAAADTTQAEISQLFTPEEVSHLESVQDDAERQQQIEQLFAQKKKMSLAEFQEHALETLVQDFENA